MSKDIEWGDGYWEGTIDICCDSCKRRHLRFDFASEEECKDTERIKRAKQKEGWITTKVNGHYTEFCCEKCRNEYIRKFTS